MGKSGSRTNHGRLPGSTEEGYGGEYNGQLRFRASPLDRRRLRALAKTWELTPSETLRRLIAEAGEKLGFK